jgi:DNA-directed RNA polymerase subunit RPC12/RpoP
MPLLTCPECGKRSRVRRHLLGQSVRCPSCKGRFLAKTPRVSPSRWVRPSHPFGLALAAVLFVAAVVLVAEAIWVALHAQDGMILHQAMQQPTFIGNGFINIYAAIGCCLLGGMLFYRWRYANKRRR